MKIKRSIFDFFFGWVGRVPELNFPTHVHDLCMLVLVLTPVSLYLQLKRPVLVEADLPWSDIVLRPSLTNGCFLRKTICRQVLYIYVYNKASDEILDKNLNYVSLFYDSAYVEDLNFSIISIFLLYCDTLSIKVFLKLLSIVLFLTDNINTRKSYSLLLSKAAA